MERMEVRKGENGDGSKGQETNTAVGNTQQLILPVQIVSLKSSL